MVAKLEKLAGRPETVVPTPDQLVTAAKTELKARFGRDFEVPTPLPELFETLKNLARRGIEGFDEVYYQPGIQLGENDNFWEGRWQGRRIVKPQPYFWRQIRDGNFPPEVAKLEEGWFIEDSRGKPRDQGGKLAYSKNDYLAKLMASLRFFGEIEGRYHIFPVDSRFGASPQEIEKVILPAFASSTAERIVRTRKYIEFNVRGNISHPEWGETNTWEWFCDSVIQGTKRLRGGSSDCGGLADVGCGLVDSRSSHIGFSPVVEFPSKPR